MLHVPLFVAATILLSSCALRGSSSPQRATEMNSQVLDGAYELVSETTILTKPQKLTTRRTSDDWTGTWLFHNGRYSQASMKKIRDWYSFPRNQEDLGYESSAGTYKVKGNNITLQDDVSLNPLGIGRITLLEYELKGDTLSLTETMHPYMEDLSEGQRTTVLRRTK